MNYTCKCTPTQEYPHIVKSAHIKHFWDLPLSISRRLHPATSCDNHPVPQKEWSFKIFGRYYEIGKIIY